MKRFMALVAGSLLLAGCAACPVDYDFGTATKNSMTMQIAFPDAPFAAENTIGMPGIHSEQIMDNYNQSFVESQQQQPNVFELDLTSGQ